MKFIDINREFTAAANSYMAQGYYINAGTMGGSQGEVAHIDLTNGTEIIRVLLTTFNNYLGTEGVELIVGRVKDDIKPNQEDRWSTVWNERLEVISSKKFYRLNNRAQDGFYGTEEEANAAEEKRLPENTCTKNAAASNAPAARNHPFIIIPFYGKYTPACAGSATQAAASGV